jgi:hypothetical protein
MEHKSIINKKLASYYQQDLKKGRISYICKFECYNGQEMSIQEFKNILLKNVKFGSRQLTLDRICNFEPHSESNCLIACLRCNKERSNRFSVDEYKAIINKTKLRPCKIQL